MAAGLEQRLADLDCGADRRGNFEGFPMKLDLTARNPGDVQKIVDQAGKMLHLPLDNPLGPVQPLGSGPTRRSNSAAFRIGVSGLRSSCPSMARNSFLWRSAS